MSGIMGEDQDPAAVPPPTGSPAEQMVAHLTARDPDAGKRVPREPPEPPEQRRRLVLRWTARVKADKAHWARKFRQMRRNQAFTHGDQWGDDGEAAATPGAQDPRYVANIALRHVQQRTASLYASNPTVIAKTRERMLAVVWDGDMATAAAAQSQMQNAVMLQAQNAQMTGIPVVPGQMPPGLDPHVLAIVTDFENVQMYTRMLKRIGKTLELLWNYNVSEQTFPFKTMMKMTVRRAIVTSVGWVKLGFQRKMKMSPEITAKIADMTQRLSTVQQISDDIADSETERDSPDAEQLKLTIQALMQEPQIVEREGLTFDYPESTAVIPDKKTKSLHGFLGADWVSQEYLLTPEEIQQVYKVDVGARYRAYSVDGDAASHEAAISRAASNANDYTGEAKTFGAVWEIYSRVDGLVYVVCDGFPDFLQEPAAPETYLDRFWPWFPVLLNEGYNEKDIYPKSDIDLLRDMQLELNRARQGLREHRKANRPKTIAAGGMLEEDDKEKLRNHPANAIIELNSLQVGQKVEDLLQPMKMPAIDPALYDTNGAFEDILRVLGQDQASMGQTTSATATEASVAQSAQHTDLSSCLDDQDDLLTELAQAGGKLLLMNVSAQTVQRVIGPGAVWPSLTKEDVIENIYLEVKAGSTGRPNKQQEVMNAQIIFPMLQRVPGISPEWMARELVRRLDDRLDLAEAFVEGIPSMDALNRIQGTVATPPPQDPPNEAAQAAQAAGPAGPVPPPQAPPPGQPPSGGPPGQGGPTGRAAPVAPPMGGGQNDPTAQGREGQQNAQVPPPTNGLLGPRTPPVPGANGMMPGKGNGPRLRPQGGVPTP